MKTIKKFNTDIQRTLCCFISKSQLVAGLVILFVSISAVSQTVEENYIYKTAYLVETIDGLNIFDDNKIETITYFDGIGRAIQTIAARAGGDRQNNATYSEYDFYGKASKEYLPWASQNQVPATSDLDLIAPSTLKSDIGTFYNTDKYQYTLNPFSETSYELSPLFRVDEQAAPGNEWQIDHNTDNDRTVKMDYGPSVGAIFDFSVTFLNNATTDEPIFNFNGYTPYFELYMTKTRDENWQPTDGIYGIEYTYNNRLGQVVLKRNTVFEGNKGPQDPNYHDTYYVYDPFGNLTYVLSPEASERIIDTNTGTMVSNYQLILDELAYQYKYDSRNRLIEKKLPGKDWEYIVYNKLDQPIFSQDAHMRANDEWLFTKYDALGRVAYTGKFWSTNSREGLQIWANGATTLYEERSQWPTTINGDIQYSIYYTNNAYPNGGGASFQIHTINYYDDYVDHTGVVLLNDVYGIDPNQTDTKGLPTVSRVRVLTTNEWVVTILGYDEKGRQIYSHALNNYLDSYNRVSTQLDFTGKPVEQKTVHFKTGNDNITVEDYFTYDHIGRLKTHEQKIDDEPVQLIAENHYDELGMLVRKDVGGQTYANGYTDMISVDATVAGDVEKTGTIPGWNAGLKTKGEIVADTEGGVNFKIITTDKAVKAGMYIASQSLHPYDYLYYGIVCTANPAIGGGYEIDIVENGAITSTSHTYNANSVLQLERVFNGLNMDVVYTVNGNVIHTAYNVDTSGMVGKAVFDDPGGKIADFNLFGNNIDKILQNVDYAYNVRGWLTDINNIAPGGLGPDDDLFKFRINYTAVQGNSNGEGLYNGNIAQTLWKTTHDDVQIRGYNHEYDQLNRIMKAESYKGASLGTMALTNNHDVDGIMYDKNGNIKSLIRRGFDDTPTVGEMDNLSYFYGTGNALERVDDAAPSTHVDYGFKDGGNVFQPDYEYDANGNMTKDVNKGIQSVTYNHLNLPTWVSINNGSEIGSISYVYDANGIKLEKAVSDEGTFSTYYADGFVYQENDATGTTDLQFFAHPEGYIVPVAETPESTKGLDDEGNTVYSTYEYVFQYKDHLGNIRLSYTDGDLDGVINVPGEIIEESNYYPFGLKQKGYNNEIEPIGNSLAQNRKYNGKELNEELGIDWYDFGARNFNPSLGRWFVSDMFAESYYNSTPYHYVSNNPINKVDFQGHFELSVKDQKTYKKLTSYLKNGIGEILNNQKIMNALAKYGGFSREQVENKIVKFGKGSIKLQIRDDLWNGAKGYYMGGIDRPIQVSKTIADKIENATTEEEKELAILSFLLTALEESVHYGDYTYSNNVPNREPIEFLDEGGYVVKQRDIGKAFQIDAFWDGNITDFETDSDTGEDLDLDGTKKASNLARRKLNDDDMDSLTKGLKDYVNKMKRLNKEIELFIIEEKKK